MNRRETLETERELIEPLIDDGEDWEASSDHSKNYSFDRLPRRSRLPFEKSPTKVCHVMTFVIYFTTATAFYFNLVIAHLEPQLDQLKV